MKVLLIDPPRTPISDGNIWKTLKRNLPSLGLFYIASLLEDNGHSPKIVDLNIEVFNRDGFVRMVKEEGFELIGITATTVQINSALFIAKTIKDAFPDKKIVMGGPHPNVMLEDVLAEDVVDYVVRGEGEFTMLELAGEKDLPDIQGLSYKSGRKIISNPRRPPIKDLDKLPFPARHLVSMYKYGPTPGNYKRLPAFSMITSRGCPGKCTFCNTDIFGKSIRFRSARNIADEIIHLIDEYRIKEISFYDDTFTISRANIEELSRIIMSERIDITWSCMSRIDCVNLQLLKLMKQAGCHSICYGIESSDEKILSNIKKRIKLSHVPEVIRWTKQAGIDVRISLMLGSPGETEKTLKNNIRYAVSLKPDLFIYNITTPFPGTEMFKWAKDKGYLKTLDWDDYDLGKVVMNLPDLRPETVEKYYRLAYRRSYIRPSYVFQRLKKIDSYESFVMHFKIFKEMLLGGV